MIHLATLVLRSDGRAMSPLGSFLQPGDGYFPAWTSTLAHDGVVGEILSATVIDADYLKDGALEITVQNREKAPLIGHPATKVWSCDEGAWTPLSQVRVGETLRIPERHTLGLIAAWAKVSKVQRAAQPDRLFQGTPRVWGRLKLGPGAYSFATPSAFVRCRA